MLSNAYFLAKFRFDTAENEPAKNLQNFRKMMKNAFFENAFLRLEVPGRRVRVRVREAPAHQRGARAAPAPLAAAHRRWRAPPRAVQPPFPTVRNLNQINKFYEPLLFQI